MRAYSATVGATDGNIIAAIITTHVPRNHANDPRPVHGPASMPRIWPTVHHHPTPARTNSAATSPSCDRAAANAGAGPACGRAETATGSGRPGEAGLREPGPAVERDPERVDARALRLGHRQVRPHRVEHAVEPDGPAGLDAERDDVLDL